MIPYIFIAMLLCVAGFIWFVLTEARHEPKRHWFTVALLYGVPLAVTLGIVCGTGAFCGGINVISHREITFVLCQGQTCILYFRV